jgi:flavin reductase (DIM6/NTAB) family NADH-FMN oxidoreductase RutF
VCVHTWNMLATLAIATASAVLTPLDAPPVLNVPTYSLATLNEDGTTNMNILTYATPAGVSPRLWAVSLYRPTRTHANWLKRQSGVLQLLCSPHSDLVYLLGGQSGTDTDKAAACAAAGFEWQDPPLDDRDADARERLLPGCVAYVRLTQVGELTSAGEHDLALCRVDGVLADLEGPMPEDALSTAALRAAGLITDRGRAVEPP